MVLDIRLASIDMSRLTCVKRKKSQKRILRVQMSRRSIPDMSRALLYVGFSL